LECIDWVHKTKRYLQDPYKETGQAKYAKKIQKVAVT